MVPFEFPSSMLGWAVFPFAVTWLFYILFMVYSGFIRAKKSGAEIPKLSYALVAPVVAFGLVLDITWNVVFGSMLFLQVPWYPGSGHPLKWTFTRRLRYWKDDPTWRGKQARWWASHLNPFDPGHV